MMRSSSVAGDMLDNSATRLGLLQGRLLKLSWAFAVAFVLHLLFVAMLVFSFQHTPVPKKTVGPKVEVVQAIAVDESKVLAELDKIRKDELRKQAQEQARLRKLEEKARKAKQEREREQKRLAEVKRKQAAEQQRLAEVKRKQAAEKKKLEAEHKAEQARLAKLKADQQALEQKRRQEEQKLAELDARRKAEEEKRKQEALALKKKQEELRRQEAEAKRLAEEQRKRDEAARLAREEELRQQMAAEEQRLATLREKYISSIQAKVQRNWRRPAGISDGASCEVLVSQLPGGLVHTVTVAGCSGGDELLQRSVKTAVLKSEPLPAPPDPSVFDREIRFVFLVTR